jgi:septal ring factor EnvC (AmiA/AmiB activator)
LYFLFYVATGRKMGYDDESGIYSLDKIGEVEVIAMEQPAQEKSAAGRQLQGIILLVLLWAGLAAGGFWYAGHYIDRTVREIQEANALNVQAMEAQITSLHNEMSAIKEALDKTDATISSTGTASEEVNKRITEMDEHLKKLEKSLNILKESGNADY